MPTTAACDYAASGFEGKMRLIDYITCVGQTATVTNVGKNLHVTTWKIKRSPVLQEDTNAETFGVAHRAPVKKDYQGSCTVFIYPGEQPEQIGFVDGAEVDLALRVGTLKCYNPWRCILGDLDLTGCDANGLLKYDCQFFGQEPLPALSDWPVAFG